MTERDTTQALAKMTDDGLFERIATAVLRVADPLCVGISHPGVNAAGKTRKSPIDGVGFVRDAEPPHMVAVHHTTTAANGLKMKWLHDPATVTPRKKGGRPTAPAGDLVKTAEIVAQERVRTPNLRATLILTTNEEPDDDLVRAVKATGAVHNIEVDVWSRSRLAHVLDNNPTGQWIRRKQLGIEQERLSKELLGELSRRSQEVFRPLDDPRAWVSRGLDRVITVNRRPVVFVVAGSGLGKSVTCYRALQAHVAEGGYGLVLPHELIAQANTLDQAVTDALRQLHTALAPGQSPLAFCSPEKPLLVIVEDINYSGQPQRLAEKIVSWASGDAQAQSPRPWRLICPIWPQALTAMRDQTRKLLEPMLVFPEPLTAAEGKNAVIARAALANRTLSTVTAEAISTALGHDPLLIALHDPNVAPHAHLVLAQFIEGALERAQAASGELSFDFRAALMDLTEQMLLRRRMDLSWREVASWPLQSKSLRCLKLLAREEELLRLSGPSTDQRLSFRHDRVRDWLLIDAACDMLTRETLIDEIFGDPFFAEIVGAVLVRLRAPMQLLKRARRLNPLALFQALRFFGDEGQTERAWVVEAINGWLADPISLSRTNKHLRWEALATLAETEGSEVPSLVTLFPDCTTPGQLARLHNGDIGGGIEVCSTFDPGVNAPFRDRQIAHARLRFAGQFIHDLDRALRSPAMNDRHRNGLLRLVGHVGEPSLAPAVEACWIADELREARLSDYLWAFARCCEETAASRYLDPICEAWAALSDETENNQSSLRNDLAAYGVRFGFQRTPPLGALDYFVCRAEQPDLQWQITYMLHGVDHPKAITFIVETLAAKRRKSKDGYFFFVHTVTSYWSRLQENDGLSMSNASREHLLRLWRSTDNDQQLRIAAFDIWAATKEAGDLEVLRGAQATEELAERVLQHRLKRGDKSAIPSLIEKLCNREQGHWWWSFAPHVWGGELTQALDEALAWRENHALRSWDVKFEEDWQMQEMIMRLPVPEAEHLLLKHWDHLRFSAKFVQAALYVGTPELCRLADASVAEAPRPAELFKFLSQRYGIKTYGHPGITREDQVLVLEPYLEHIAANDLWQLADACNEAGWFAARRRLFDGRLKNQRVAWMPEDAGARFDELVAKDQMHWIDHEIDEALKTGVTWNEYLGALEAWLDLRRSMHAMKLVAMALTYKGSRRNLVTLKIYDGIPRESLEALIADTAFAVRRRTPD
ncbi:MAG: hypothetical protein Q8N06_10430 [Hydrogenophaga sp.]|nr:hypothetical protein [Thiobacillus sp.]MDP3165849.1 hypothetical protein [Hydrogenophaga sp.]